MITIELEIRNTDTKKRWRKNKLIHRDFNKPAIVYINGFSEWYKNGIYLKDSSLRYKQDTQ